MSKQVVASVEFEPAFIAALRQIFEEMIPFNRLLGLRVTQIAPTGVSASISMKPELIGHVGQQRLHGGVISAGLDTMGGLAIMAAIGARHMDDPVLKRMERCQRISTIDLRVDYLRPGLGQTFELRGQVLRLGSRVASTRMEFLDSDGQLLSTGCGAYMVS